MSTQGENVAQKLLDQESKGGQHRDSPGVSIKLQQKKKISTTIVVQQHPIDQEHRAANMVVHQFWRNQCYEPYL
jgi:hypothetical protein